MSAILAQQGGGAGEDQPNKFQYILAACTSNATKVNEPSITYLNQGQAYELRLKKLGDLSPYRRGGGVGGNDKNRLLRCIIRICFHERRLQYMEMEQLNEWSSKHPGTPRCKILLFFEWDRYESN